MMEMADTWKIALMPSGTCKIYPHFLSFSLNVIKRQFRNDHEHIVTLIPLNLINGIVYPYLTISYLASYFVGRTLYNRGYMEKEGAYNQKRMIGSLICNLAHLATITTTIIIGIRMSRGKMLNLVKNI